ncbi:MAG: PQQ-binding-like beta-propeller repeat protein, partial [Pseudomonadota bacterium]
MTKLKFLTISLLSILLISLLGGSLIWQLLGMARTLDIEGEAALVHDQSPNIGEGWEYYGGDAGGNRYSNANQITRENVTNLTKAWEFDTQAFNGREHAKNRSAFENTPILVEDSLIVCTQFNDIIALEPDTGKERWRFNPKVDLEARPANGYKCRGVAYWQSTTATPEQHCASRIFTGTGDSRLIAVDAKSGKLCEGFGDGGQVALDVGMPLRWPGEFQITSAPVVVNDVLITGSAISDNLRTEAPRGTVFAFDATSGEPLWTFNPVPQDASDPASDTWQAGSAQLTGHANVWSSMSADPERGLVFLPTSSPSPDYYGGNRVGDNRYANSLVAL